MIQLTESKSKPLIEQGKYQEAIPLAARAVELAKRVWARITPRPPRALNNLGVLFHKLATTPKPYPYYQEALRICQEILGPEHPAMAVSLNNLAGLYQEMGEYAKAEPLYQEALQIRQKVLGL